ncbi:LRR receptor-like serine threonine-protein kinase [Musa troglodytarum]|uniref:LRR receptor-like serine threonine-protein kinase n=1 Tax=Musa troglodytarum TaxID=320322 RepID=A0A9E7JL36_9LILI|nr:LRR receptor-like serine threonine-protein kinase [Musa troglodytarum]
MGGRTPLLVLTFSLAVLSIKLGISHGCRETERKALIDFKRGLHDPSNRLSSWVGEDCCAWEGVGCSNISGHQLNRLDLSGNYFMHKPIPKFLGAFRRLTYLNLSGAGFMGRVPAQLGNLSTLQHLDLSYNCYWDDEGGSLSHVNFTSLTTLDLRGNYINSTIPDWVFNITSLEFLYLGGNDLHGFFPDSVTKLTSLKALDLSGSVFQDGFMQVTHISNLCKLQILCLSSVPINDVLANLEMVFSGCLRNSMEELDLSGTQLSGSFPDWLGNIKNLKSLDLSSNSLCGSVPASIGNLSLLQHLSLGSNDLNGTISKGIGQLKSLVDLDLHENSLSLSEDDLANLSSLEYLDISYNFIECIKEAFPNWLPSGLRYLYLSDNKITGEVPQFFPKLKYLYLSNNSFSGNLSPRITNTMPSLQWFDLSMNNMSDNLSRVIPNCWKTSSNLLLLDLSSNKLNAFTGSIPQLSSLPSLRILDLSNNNLSGTIPQSFGNYLIGQIPWSIGRMKQLEVLDLSRNNLSGAIPSDLAALNFLNHLNLSYNNLSGRIPNGNQLQTFTDSSIYAGNPNLCGPPLTKNCTLNIAKAGEEEQNEDSSKSRMETLWLYTSITLGFIIGFWAICGSLLLQQTWRTSYFRAIDNMFDKLYVMMVVTVAKYKRKL